MKKTLICLLASICVCFSCTKQSVNTISLSEDVLTMKVGDMHTLEATTTASSIEWSSSNTAVVTVYEGIVQAKGVGHANIIATTDGAQAMCNVYVTSRDGGKLSLSPEYTEVNKGEHFQYEYSSTYDVPLTFSSSNEEVATVDAQGVVYAKKAGVSTISITNGAETVSSTFAVKHTWGEYHLVWEDDFNGTSINPDSWNIEVNGNGGGNKELQYYTDRPENIRLEDGNLILELRKENYNNREYTSGRMQSRGKRQFKYGKVEARIMFPSGGGTWPAFWMLGANGGWPKCGEIDIIEHVGNQPTMLSFALHTKMKNGMSGNNWSSRSYFQGVENEYHTYAIEWKEEVQYGCDVIDFLYDGEVCATVQESLEHINDANYWPFDQEHYIIFNLAIGGTMGGNVDNTIFEDGKTAQMKVDWVRVYQREEKE